MKKLVLAVLLSLMLCTAGAFAEHPDGFGIGIMGRGGYRWDTGTMSGGALSLKAPGLPIYWGIDLDLYSNYIGFGVTGDYYFIDSWLASEIGLGWYFGLGGFVDFGTYDHRYDYYDWTYLGFGLRVPIGLSWQFFRNSKVSFELFGELAPSLGLGLRFWDDKYDDWHGRAGDNRVGLGGDIAGALGFRVWF
jgi:hypothetical protein